jgi:hypothetical protein
MIGGRKTCSQKKRLDDERITAAEKAAEEKCGITLEIAYKM